MSGSGLLPANCIDSRKDFDFRDGGSSPFMASSEPSARLAPKVAPRPFLLHFFLALIEAF
jgi:hypothetical protein